jgi:hypothetical protein
MTLDELLNAVGEGRRCFDIKKDSSLQVIAHAVMVYNAAGPKDSPKGARKWLRREIDNSSDDIVKENNKRKAQRDRGRKCLSGKITVDKLKADGSADPFADFESLKDLGALDDSEFNRGQLVKLKKFDDDVVVELTAFIRWFLGLFARHDAPLVSRYATVVKVTVDQFIGQPNVTVEQIVDSLKADGGFEAVLHVSRGTKPTKKAASGSSETPIDQTDQMPEVEGIALPSDGDFRSETVPVRMRLPPGMSSLPGGPACLHAMVRHGDEIEIVAFQPMTQAEFEEVTAKYGSALRGPAEIIEAPPIAPTDNEGESVDGKASN